MFIDYDTLFVFVDDFCKSFEPWYKKQLIAEKRRKRHRSGQLRLSEVLTILLAYHESGMVCFKFFYMQLLREGRNLFPHLVTYERFVTLIKRAFPPLMALLKSLQGEITEYLFIDSTPMPVCHNMRIHRHRTFKDMAARGRTSTGWFFGLKLHMLFNTKGEVIRLVITPGNVNDRAPVLSMLKGITARLIGDKGYLSQDLFTQLFNQGVTLITKVKKNMANRLMALQDKIMLRKRSFIETIFSSLKSLNTWIHHRHRSPINALAHLIAGIISYQIRTHKPNISLKP